MSSVYSDPLNLRVMNAAGGIPVRDVSQLMGQGRLDACVYCTPGILCGVGRASPRRLSLLCCSCDDIDGRTPVSRWCVHRLRHLVEKTVVLDADIGWRDAKSLTVVRMEQSDVMMGLMLSYSTTQHLTHRTHIPNL